MNSQKLTQKLIESDAEERRQLLERYKKISSLEIARSLQQLCYEVWTSEPQKVAVIVKILREITHLTSNKEVAAYADWTEAIEMLVNGKLEDCLNFLNKSETSFKNLGEIHTAATTQISKLYALALLGRYDEAIACGLAARDVFIAYKDIYSAGKVENNIGNLYWRRDFYRESEPFLESAWKRFAQIDDQRQLAMVENCQAFVKALQNDFRKAEMIYKVALKRAKLNDLTVTEAEIETGMSNLYLFQGRFNLALKFMEGSRQKYDELQMPQQTANCELEIADIYLELNLLPEAIEFYKKSEAKFIELGIQAELARNFLNHAKALMLLGENNVSKEFLDKAEKIFSAEGNKISVAAVKLNKARIHFDENDFQTAEKEIKNALKSFKKGGNLRQELAANWLLGEIYIAQNKSKKAQEILGQTRRIAKEQSPQIEYLCLVSLGKLLHNEKYFLEAIELIENSRSSLNAEEFRTAFLSDKLLPYNELVKAKLTAEDFVEAFIWHENSRSRSLLESLNSTAGKSSQDKKIVELREELNWYYSRINRQTASGLAARKEIADLRKLAGKCEKDFAEFARRLQIDQNGEIGQSKKLDLAKLQQNLHETVLVEFFIADGKISAFILNDENLDVFRDFADENSVNTEIKQFLFQIKTARFQDKLSSENWQIAFARMLRHSQKIYDVLLRPLERFLNRERITFVAANLLHYLPFQALHDGEKYLIERREISYAPSAAILQNCLEGEVFNPKNALLVGVADEKTPLVKTELEMLGKLFENSVKLVDNKATLKNISQNIESAELLHLACHGVFRPDNPAFSSLALFNENLTVNDARNLNLTNKFVTLSACETGLNKIVSGEELIGLTRGFLAAGAGSLLLSLWTVNDKATLDLMKNFYREMLRGNGFSKSLQTAQIKALKETAQPYFWSPFVLIGHW